MAAITGLISSAVRAVERFDEGKCAAGPLARPPCVCSFHSKCQTAARVRSFSRRGCVRGFLLSQKTKAASARPLTEAHLKGGLPAIKGGEAPKDACHPVSAPFLPEGRGCGSDPSQTSLRSLRNLSACGTARLPALRCGACPGERTPGLSPGRASRETRCEGVTSA